MSTLRRTQPLVAIPEVPALDYVSASLDLASRRHRLDSYRPDNDLRRTQEIPLYRTAAEWSPESLEKLLARVGG